MNRLPQHNGATRAKPVWNWSAVVSLFKRVQCLTATSHAPYSSGATGSSAPALPRRDRSGRKVSTNIEQIATELGADVVGIAPVERFRQSGDIHDFPTYLPTGYQPDELLPGARSVVAIAIKVLHGVVTSNLRPTDTTYAFGNFGYVHLNRLLNAISYDLARHLEEQSWASLPLGACGAIRFDRSAYEEGRTVGPLHGIFSLKRAAVLAGVGRRAKSGLVATEFHGTRVRLGAVITTARLTGTPVLQGAPCPTGCNLCSAACPMGAIGSDGQVNHVSCYSDQGRRGITERETVNELTKVFPLKGTRSGYLPSEHAAIDGFGNRMCRAVCMGVCPLWKNASQVR